LLGTTATRRFFYDQVNQEVEEFKRRHPREYAALECDALNKYKDKFTLKMGQLPDWLAMASQAQQGAGQLRRRRVRPNAATAARMDTNSLFGQGQEPTSWAGSDQKPFEQQMAGLERLQRQRRSRRVDPEMALAALRNG
jgi:hypothetical protein